ncbi:MAG: holo-ACP synthase [Proteobacteria bacterium]|nr:holo-ACP synthase [Pseudomonadota bacterium]
MIFGVGTDIVAVARLGKLYERHGEHAVDKLLAATERADFARASDPARFLAKRFAAKEALGKALGIGVASPATLTNIAVAHDQLGKPAFAYAPALANYLAERGLSAHLSISDEHDFALAFVVLEHV